ncbi:MAG: dTDP-4-dehydrorhamnose 3,5-epimerase family protein [Thermoplasmata archaeon]
MELIDGVREKKLRLIPDERGWLMEILRSDEELFEKFGQVYVTACYPGVVKAWHYHRRQTDNFCAVWGMAKVVLYDGREGSPTRGRINEFHIGELNPTLLRIPPLVLHGFTAEGGEPTLIVNVPTEVYNREKPDEHRVPYDSPEIPYDWRVRHG